MIVVAIEPTLDKTLFARASFNSVDEEDMLLRDFFASPCVRTSFFPLKNEQSMQENSDKYLIFDSNYVWDYNAYEIYVERCNPLILIIMTINCWSLLVLELMIHLLSKF